MTRVAFVHDWLVTYRGGEKVLASLLKLFPDAPIYTLFYDPKHMPTAIRSRKIFAAPQLLGLGRLRKALLPLYPKIIQSFDLNAYDLIISSSSCVAKGVIPAQQAKHLCYIHSPMRYVWDQQDIYLAPLRRIPGLRQLTDHFADRLRRWDSTSNERVDQFVANSTFVQQRVRDYYHRESVVIPPPIETSRLLLGQDNEPSTGAYFLAAGAMVAYKRFDLAIEACKRARAKLIIAGSGPEESALRRLAGDADVTFVISPDDAALYKLLRGAKALLFPGIEDFGMIAIEAMSCGTPVIAFDRGGARDFIVPGQTGEFFSQPDAKTLAYILEGFDKTRYDSGSLHSYAGRYSEENFRARMQAQVHTLLNSKG